MGYIGQRLGRIIERLPARRNSPADAVAGYAAALGMVVVALAVRELLGPPELGLQFVTFFPAVALTAVYGGFGPGMLATALSASLASFLYLPPYGSFVFEFHSATLTSNLAFLLDELMVCGAIQAMHNHYRDYQRVSESLGEQRRLLDSIIEGTTDAIFLKDAASRYRHCNSAHLQLTGRSLGEVVGRDMFALYPEPQARAMLEDDRAVMAARRVTTYEETIDVGHGNIKSFLTTKGPIFDQQGRVTGLFGVARDITEKKLAEAALREREEFNRRIVDSSADCIKVLDLDGRLLSMSEGGQRLLEIDDIAPYLGADWIAFWQERDRPAVRAAIAAARKGGCGQFQAYCPSHSGVPRWWDVAITPMPDANGKVERLLAVSRDVTTRKGAEDEIRAAKAEAERANNAKSRFLAAASHDLRQPLTALGLYVGVLGEKIAPSESQLLANIKNCVGSLSDLLTDLLDLSKLEAGVVKPNISNFSIAEKLAKIVSAHTPEAMLKGLQLRYPHSTLIARTDPVLFGRMISNLIANAIHYTERGGVLVGFRRHRGKMWVEVWDTGIGIPADKLDEIFEEFKQLGDDARNRGSGLGLAIVARTAALLGLQIRVRSRVGRGSLFAIEFPLGRPTKAMAQLKPKRRVQAARIALVDDNAGVLSALACSLENIGHRVVAAASGAELLAQLDRHAPDIVISDYRLAKGETGFDVINSLRTTFGDTLPAVMITGDTDPYLMRSMADRGIVIQHKPLEIGALQACIGELVDRPAA